MSEEKMETMNDFKEELEASFRELHVGDIVDGTVIGLTDDGVTVDLKYYTQGFIRNADMSNDPTFKVSEDVHEGDEIKAKILKMDNGDGSIALSRKAANSFSESAAASVCAVSAPARRSVSARIRESVSAPAMSRKSSRSSPARRNAAR